MVKIGTYIVVFNRLCEILLCQCNPKFKKVYIRCVDIETSKQYSVFISNSLFTHSIIDGCFMTTIDSDLSHIANHKFLFSNETKTTDDVKHDVTMYSAKGNQIIIGCFLKTDTNLYRIADVNINNDVATFVALGVYSNENLLCDISGNFDAQSNTWCYDNVTLNINEFSVENNKKNICCKDIEQNSVKIIL